MERLTYRDETGKAWAKLDAHADAEETMSFGRIALNRLAAYEDTDLMPEEVAELAEAKQEGRLILPPCDEDYRGLKVKYRVFKVRNNEPVENCFVLRPDKDPAARAALECYANKTPNDQLAWDILKWLESMGGEKD